MKTPLISVLLPVYNGEQYLKASINSVLSQTFTDFECIIINDGSTDNSAAVAASLRDQRIRLYNQENIGLAATLNRGIDLARGKYVARQDQDDLSNPRRLALQANFMESHPDHALLGTRATIMVDDTPTDRVHDHPLDDSLVKLDLLFNNPFVHSSVMFRREAVLALGGYSMNPHRQPPEDYELWSRIARRWRVANLPERLLQYREVSGSMSRTGENPFLDKLLLICAENISFAAGFPTSNVHAADAAALVHAAPGHLSKAPNIKAIFALVRCAAMSIDPRRANPAVWEKLEYYLDGIAHHYFHASGQPVPLRYRHRGIARRILSWKRWSRLLGFQLHGISRNA
jgi:hypothetical protein